MPQLVTQRVITINDKLKIASTGKTEYERAQYLLDHYIAAPLSAGDPRFFNTLLDLMSTTSKCSWLTDEIQQYRSTTLKHQKFSSELKHTHKHITYSHTLVHTYTHSNITNASLMLSLSVASIYVVTA